ncbi:hypothetical protein Nepgr_031273 [Nepenthes gracilis]|uniref:Uncharacterized protein n=1 Tax=Nepenthes gracilis TaxID=150966 RepID=A0AAD3Y6N3_NEPGR|nr:hypothetical protein Nepgr_031273 [Nepenthes gracilis]
MKHVKLLQAFAAHKRSKSSRETVGPAQGTKGANPRWRKTMKTCSALNASPGIGGKGGKASPNRGVVAGGSGLFLPSAGGQPIPLRGKSGVVNNAQQRASHGKRTTGATGGPQQ